MIGVIASKIPASKIPAEKPMKSAQTITITDEAQVRRQFQVLVFLPIHSRRKLTKTD